MNDISFYLRDVKSILLLFIVCLSLQCSAQAQTITGNVIDGYDKGYLEEVRVVNLTNGDSSLSNTRGYFRILGNSGDSLIFSKKYYISNQITVGKDRHFLTELYLNARTLPQFNVYANQYKVPYLVGGTASSTGMSGFSDRKAGPGKIYKGMSDNPGLVPAITLDGLFSYFMKSERNKREYARKLALIARKKDYLDLIQSDSVMTALKLEYKLSNQDLDDLIIQFNLHNKNHEFLDMKRSMVEQRLIEFFDLRTGRRRERSTPLILK